MLVQYDKTSYLPIGSFRVKSTHKKCDPNGFGQNLVLAWSLLRHKTIMSFRTVCCIVSELQPNKT